MGHRIIRRSFVFLCFLAGKWWSENWGLLRCGDLAFFTQLFVFVVNLPLFAGIAIVF